MHQTGLLLAALFAATPTWTEAPETSQIDQPQAIVDAINGVIDALSSKESPER